MLVIIAQRWPVQKDLWGSPASQPSHLGKFQASERSYFKKQTHNNPSMTALARGFLETRRTTVHTAQEEHTLKHRPMHLSIYTAPSTDFSPYC